MNQKSTQQLVDEYLFNRGLREDQLSEITRQLARKAKEEEADNNLNYARARFKKAIERLFEFEVARIKDLTVDPTLFSTQQWERLITDVEMTARRFTDFAEQLAEARPLTRITDVPSKDITLRTGGGERKYSMAEISEAKTLINERKLSLEEIAERLAMSPGQVSAIKNERIHKEVAPRIKHRLNRFMRRF